MKKILLSFIVLLSCPSFAGAQTSRLRISAEVNDKNQVVFSARRYDSAPYTVVIHLSESQNLRTSSRFEKLNVISDGRILTLESIDPSKPLSYKYTYGYIAGSVNPRKVDREFVYRLPFSTAVSREVRGLANFFDRHMGGDERSVDHKAFQFIMERADTVYAARKGVVLTVIDKHDPLHDVGLVDMNTENNQVSIEHADGTIAWYGVLERGSIAVTPGQKVYPGTPIARAGTLDGEVYQLRFSLSFRTDNLNRIAELSDWKFTSNYLDPLFATAEGNMNLTPNTFHTPVAPKELITREMTKKEIRASEE